MRSPARLLLLLVAACSGSIGGAADETGEPAPAPAPTAPADRPGDLPATPGAPPGSPPPPVIPPPPTGTPAAGGPAIRPLRRLTRFEYDNTIRDLLGDTSRPASALPEETDGPHGFDIASGVSSLDALVLQELGERLAASAVKNNLARLVPCKLPGDDACGKAFVAAFGKRAFRRPLLVEEQTALEALYTHARAQLGYDFAQSVRVVLSALLQSPELLYHWELGPQAPAVLVSGKVLALTPYEIA